MTAVALPAIWLFTRGEAGSGSAAPTIAAAGLAAATASPGSTDEMDHGSMGSVTAIFIDGPTTPPKPAVIQIVVPAAVEGAYTEGRATYKTEYAQPDSCSAPGAPSGAKLTVTNRDNGRSITCVNRSPVGLAEGIVLQLSTPQFSELGQLVEAPIPVRITWNGSE